MAVKSVGDGVTVVHPSSLRISEAPVTTARKTRGQSRGAAAAPPPMSELDAVIAGLGAADVQIVKRLDIVPAAGRADAPTRKARGAGAGAGAGAAQDVEVSIDLAPNEDAVVLIVQDDEYHWELPDGTSIGARMARERSPGGAKRIRTVTFRLAVRSAAAPASKRRTRGATTRQARGFLGKVVAFVLKFARQVVSDMVIKKLEKDVKEQLVRVSSNEPESWDFVDGAANLPSPDDRPARVLLLVHGTFSSTLGSFSGLRHTPEGLAFLDAAMLHYDLILGFDHRTLSELPIDNAREIVGRLSKIAWNHPPVIDTIGFSRGGLVLRSILERVMPESNFKATFNRAIFVGCTNGGTLLAEPENWAKLVDVYTNLAAAATRGLAFFPQAKAVAMILTVAIKSIGLLVKYLASFIVDGGGVPGIASMEPDGEVVKALNAGDKPTTVAAQYLAVTNDFEPGRAEQDGSAALLPVSFREKLINGLVDRLMGESNDLVVNTKSMTTVGTGDFPGEIFPLGRNGATIHTTYFRDPRVAAQLGTWLLPAGERTPRAVARGRGSNNGTRSVATKSPNAAKKSVARSKPAKKRRGGTSRRTTAKGRDQRKTRGFRRVRGMAGGAPQAFGGKG